MRGKAADAEENAPGPRTERGRPGLKPTREELALSLEGRLSRVGSPAPCLNRARVGHPEKKPGVTFSARGLRSGAESTKSKGK